MASLWRVTPTDPDRETTWFDDAVCPQTDPALFFPEKGCSPNEAKEVCSRCPVRTACLQWALDNYTTYGWAGVWGGTGQRERLRIYRAWSGSTANEFEQLIEEEAA